VTAERGFSLLEALWALGLSSLILLAVLLGHDQAQITSHDLGSLAERDENLRLASLLVPKWTSGTGNESWTGCCRDLVFEDEGVRFQADSDGPDGFPDSLLESSYESFVLRHRNDAVQIRSGRGSFQPALRQIGEFQIEEAGEDRILVEVEGVSRPLLSIGRESKNSGSIEVYLWNRYPNLFAEARP